MNVTEGREPVRLLALSDGLFATVLTLLVLDLRIPDTLNLGGGNVTIFIKWLGPHLFSYLLTFLVGGTYWLGHHRDFDHVVHVDRSLLGCNLLFLLFIGLLPFSTATISLGNFRGNVFSFYWAIYAANIVLAGVMLQLTWIYAFSHHQVKAEMTRQQSQYLSLRQLVVPSVFLISIVAEYLAPRAFLGPYTLWLIPLAFWAVDRYFAPADLKKATHAVSRSEVLWRVGTILPWLLIIGLAVWAATF